MNKSYYTSRNGKKTHDEYYTKREMVVKLLDSRYSLDEFSKVYCPCDSDESEFVKYLKESAHEFEYTSDDYNNHIDKFKSADVIVTNPPFNGFAKFFDTCINNCDECYLVCSVLSLNTIYRRCSIDEVDVIWAGRSKFNTPEGEKEVLVALVHYKKGGVER